MKRSPLKRTTGLSARGKGGACPPKPSGAERNGIGTPKRRKDEYDGKRWRAEGLAIAPGCERCHGRVAADDRHHIVYRQILRRELGERYGVAAMDQANGMSLCRPCHNAHHAWFDPIVFERLPAEAVAFAERHGLRWFLDRTYPGVQA